MALKTCCPDCGKPLRLIDSNFCVHCGHDQRVPVAAYTPRPTCPDCDHGLIVSGDGWNEPVVTEFCECEAGIEAEKMDALTFGILDDLGIPVIEQVAA